jgi:hypothetical protein
MLTKILSINMDFRQTMHYMFVLRRATSLRRLRMIIEITCGTVFLNYIPLQILVICVI